MPDEFVPPKKKSEEEEFGESHASTIDDELQMLNEYKLNNLKFELEYATFQSMDEFYPVG